METVFKWVSSSDCEPGVAVSFFSEGFSVARLKDAAQSGKEVAVGAEFFPVQGRQQQLKLLHKVVASHQLHHIPATIVLEPGSYRLLQVPIPDVLPSEMDAALRWKIKDLVSGIDIGEAMVRSFPMPGQRNSSSPLLFVVVADRGVIQHRVELANDAGLQVDQVIPSELSLRHLFSSMIDSVKPHLLLMMFHQETFLLHMVAGEIYRVRELNFGAVHMPGVGSEQEDESVPMRIVDEVSRFAVFCGRNCEGGSAQKIIASSVVVDDEEVVELLTEKMELEVEPLPFDLLDPHIIPVMGGSFRDVELAV